MASGDKFGLGRLNGLVGEGEIKAPRWVMGRDHLDCGRVAFAVIATESMGRGTGSDAIADCRCERVE